MNGSTMKGLCFFFSNLTPTLSQTIPSMPSTALVKGKHFLFRTTVAMSCVLCCFEPESRKNYLPPCKTSICLHVILKRKIETERRNAWNDDQALLVQNVKQFSQQCHYVELVYKTLFWNPESALEALQA